MREEMLKVAIEEYGKCIGMESCGEMVEAYLIETYWISKEEASMYREEAFEEWVKAYCE
jgi:hypothetical protein